jgi:hypothetical protein
MEPNVRGDRRQTRSRSRSRSPEKAIPSDPVRDKLLLVRRQLQLREQELLMDATSEGVRKIEIKTEEGMEGDGMQDDVDANASSEGSRWKGKTRKQRIMEKIMQSESSSGFNGNGLLL